MLTPFGPRERCGPRLGLGLDRIGASLQKQSHQLDTSPAAGPSKRSALEQVVANVQSATGVEYGDREREAIIGRQTAARRCDGVQNRGTPATGHVRVATIK